MRYIIVCAECDWYGTTAVVAQGHHRKTGHYLFQNGCIQPLAAEVVDDAGDDDADRGPGGSVVGGFGAQPDDDKAADEHHQLEQ